MTMERRPAPFKQIDVTRAAKGVTAAGLSVGSVVIDPDGKIVVTVGEGGKHASDRPDPDELL